MRVLIAFSLLIFLLAGCSERRETFHDPEGLACVKRALSHQFMVKYKDGRLRRLDTTRSQINELLADETVDWAEPNYWMPAPRVRASDVQTQARFPDISAGYAWARGHNGRGVIVAVVDSGIDVTHPLLRRALRRGATDGTFGWNFTDNSSEVVDESGHGTHIAGLIAAEPSSDTEFRGLAPGVALIAADFMNGETGDEFNAIRAVEYSLKRGARVINNSWSNFCSHSLRTSFEGWQSEPAVFVNAAGNDGLFIDPLAVYPANLHLVNAITVGSVDDGGERSSFSNFGMNVGVYAPGEEIFSLTPGALAHGLLIARTGTSMAAAFVSGAVALLWGAYPEKSAAEITALVRGEARSKSADADVINVRALFEAAKRQGHSNPSETTARPLARSSEASSAL
jgi:subtilisin family serine protease